MVWALAILSSLAAWWAWGDTVATLAMVVSIGVFGSLYVIFRDPEAFTDKVHYTAESRHRIHAGQAEWHDLYHFLLHPHWKRRISGPEREMLVHCTRTYHDGGRETNTAAVLIEWLRSGEDHRLLFHALTLGHDDDRLRAHLDGTDPIIRGDVPDRT
jgi:hypothetical protein